MQLLLLHPEVAFRDCQHCLEFVYDEESGELLKNAKGEPMRRMKGVSPMCRRQDCKCPKGTPENQKTLSAQNWHAWQHYRKCRLTGHWPDDDLVAERGILLQEIEATANLQQQIKLTPRL